MEKRVDSAEPRKLIGRASIVAAGTIYQQGVAFLSGLIVARIIGASDYGIFNLARNLVDLTQIATRLGLDLGLQRYFGESQGAQDGAPRAVVLLRLRLLACAVALVPLIAVALGLGRYLEANVYHYSRFADVLLCLSLALPFITDIGVLGGAYRGILKLSPSVIAECVLLPSIRLAVIVLLFVAGWRLWAVATGTTLASLVASAFLAKRARIDFPVREPMSRESWADALRVVRYSGVLAAAGLVTTLTSSMDLLILGRFSTAQDLGQYSLVKMLLVLMGVFGVAFTTGLGALVAQRHFRGDLDGVAHVISLTARLVTLVTLPIFAIFLFWGAPITRLFGASFVTSQAVISWLALSQFVVSVFGPCGWALSMTGKHVLEVKILAAGLVLSALLCLVAVPAFGQLGAAVATCCSVATVNLLRMLFVRRSIGGFPFRADIFAITAAGIGLAWASHLLVAQFALSMFWSTACGIGCFAVAYAVAGWMQLLNVTEKDGISRAIRDGAHKLSWNVQ
jgi:O-antigen/teichoic acid export membrane protein